MGIKIFLLFLLMITNYNPQELKTPLEKSDYNTLTSSTQVIEYLEQAVDYNDNLKMEFFAESVEGRRLPVIKISSGIFGDDKNKIKVLIFAQQHGNEQSGKEGALLLINKFSLGYLDGLLDRMDIIIIPQMNPDGSEKNQRRNANDADLNRDHLILLQPETQGLHKLFYEYLPEATMDVHEYNPYSEDWIKYGYVKNFDEQVGCTTNPNVSKEVRDISNQFYLPFIEKYLYERGFSFHNYILGGPPELELIRHSTFDINDGRQSMGIQNTFSFIQEGKNGKDSLDNIERRSEGQMAGMMGLLVYSYNNKDEIKNLVDSEREKLVKNEVSDKVAIQLDHFPDRSKLELPLKSYYSDKDTVVTVNDYRPVVKSLFDVERPKGYLVPKILKEIVEWADRHSLAYYDYKKSNEDKIEQYFISGIDSMDFERDIIVNPIVEVKEIPNKLSEADYIFIPTKQLRNNLIVIALEPKSELGLVTYKNFEHLLKKGERFPVMRVVNNTKQN